ncbi:MAG: Fic family protein [Clostridia bacterium]|nr:Fic family protein [Clostridia bacterium]
MTGYEKSLTLWKQKNIKNDAELAEALNGNSIAYAYHSGKIENDQITYHDTREIFDHDGVTSYTGDLRTLFEIRNARDAFELLLNAFAQKRPVDEALIKEFQYQLTLNTYDERRWRLGERPGQYKLHDYVTGKDEVGASAEDVQEEMDELIEDLAEIPDEKVLTAAAFFHAKFENIHPFAEGNGRTGRLVMNYILLLHNHPPVIVHEEDRKNYYEALEAWDREQVLGPLIGFLKEQTAKTWKRQIEMAERKNSEPER